MTIQVITGHGRVDLPAQPGQTLLEVLRHHGNLSVHAPCGGRGTCKKCTVYLISAEGERACLACQTLAEDGMILRLPEESTLHVELGAEKTVDFMTDGQEGFCIACDIGTTTVVCKLVELESGEVKGTLVAGNDQRSYGADVISRIKASMDGKLPEMAACIRLQLGRMISSLCQNFGVSLKNLSTMAVAANTTMCHLLAGISPDSMGTAPYVPESTFGYWMDAMELNLPFDGKVYIAPAVSGYVGGDITADILAAGLDETDEPTLLIDVGTNGEMALGYGDHFVCCSTAAGPAFEGAQIKFGMTAAPGAISSVEWKWGEVKCGVIGDTAPKGICGSGLIGAVAVMLECGAMDETGRMLDPDEDDIPEELEPYLYLLEDEPAFCLAGDISVTQSDVRKLQLGKGAIAAGVQVLRELYGKTEIKHLLLAGGFGSFIRPESAAKIGLIPSELLPVTEAIGNAAAEGARMALCSEDCQNRLADIQRNMQYQELSGSSKFNDAYIEMMMFPE